MIEHVSHAVTHHTLYMRRAADFDLLVFGKQINNTLSQNKQNDFSNLNTYKTSLQIMSDRVSDKRQRLLL